MKFNIAFATATALGLIMASGAYADSNTLYITQAGSANVADVHQSAGTGGNNIGSVASPFLQDGNNNKLTETQATGGGFYRGDNDILKGRQVGNNNSFSDYYSNNAGWNRINNVVQHGSSNALSISRDNQLYGTVGTVVQGAEASAPSGGNGNGISISQSTYPYPYGQPVFTGGNTVTLVKQIGSNNAYGYYAGTSISQGGSRNLITEATIEGSNNMPGTTAVQSILQRGTGNGQSASVARTLGSNGNGINVSEIGDWNNFDVRQGLSVYSTGNYATVTQTGNYNSATATQYGSGNNLTVNQKGDSNTSTTLFNGNDNGVGSLTGAAGALAGVTQGVVLQDSTAGLGYNLVDYRVYGNGNLFAFAQIGGHNTIDGNVGTGSHDSSNNQAAVLQTGNYNVTSFSQTGAGGNIVAANQ
jgi:hypothetical protein